MLRLSSPERCKLKQKGGRDTHYRVSPAQIPAGGISAHGRLPRRSPGIAMMKPAAVAYFRTSSAVNSWPDKDSQAPPARCGDGLRQGDETGGKC